MQKRKLIIQLRCIYKYLKARILHSLLLVIKRHIHLLQYHYMLDIVTSLKDSFNHSRLTTLVISFISFNDLYLIMVNLDFLMEVSLADFIDLIIVCYKNLVFIDYFLVVCFKN